MADVAWPSTEDCAAVSDLRSKRATNDERRKHLPSGAIRLQMPSEYFHADYKISAAFLDVHRKVLPESSKPLAPVS